jgi:hypothetical protein
MNQNPESTFVRIWDLNPKLLTENSHCYLPIPDAHDLLLQCKVTPYNWHAPVRNVKMFEFAYTGNDLKIKHYTNKNMYLHGMVRRFSPER